MAERFTVVVEPFPPFHWVDVTLLYWSSSDTVKGVDADEPWATTNGLEVNASLLGAPAFMVSTWVAEASPFEVAEIIGFPACVSP